MSGTIRVLHPLPDNFLAGRLRPSPKRDEKWLRRQIAELANDWIVYVPDQDAFKLGGYQVWTGFHSYCEPGTGERMVDEAVAMLKKLKSEE